MLVDLVIGKTRRPPSRTPSSRNPGTKASFSFSENSAYEEEYYWIDYAQLTEDEYEDKSQGCFNHWYSVLELFQDEVPVNLKDPDTISIFGTGKAEALADLSYGC